MATALQRIQDVPTQRETPTAKFLHPLASPQHKARNDMMEEETLELHATDPIDVPPRRGASSAPAPHDAVAPPPESKKRLRSRRRKSGMRIRV